eukprot:3938894-Rhodomonas_salina.1
MSRAREEEVGVARTRASGRRAKRMDFSCTCPRILSASISLSCVCCCVGGSPPSFLTVITTTTTNIIIATSSSSSSLTWYAKRKKASAELRRPSRKTLGVGERRRRMLDGRMARMVAARLIMNSCKPMPKTSA